jgi:hypothetical protein
VTAGNCDHGIGEHPPWSVAPLGKGRWRVTFSDYHNGMEYVRADDVAAWMQGTELRIRYEVKGLDDPKGPILGCGATTDVEMELELPRAPERVELYRSVRTPHLVRELAGRDDEWRELRQGRPWGLEDDYGNDGKRCRFYRLDHLDRNTVLVAIEGYTCRHARYAVAVVAPDGRTLLRKVAWLAELNDAGEQPFAETNEGPLKALAAALMARPAVVTAGKAEEFTVEDGDACAPGPFVHDAREELDAAKQWIVVRTGVGADTYFVPWVDGNRFVEVGTCVGR